MTVKKSIDEIKSIITSLEEQADKTTAWDATDKANLKKRIAHLLKKTNPELDASHKLDTDLVDLEVIEQAVGADKLQNAKEKKELQDKLTQAETDNNAKDALLKQKDEEIGKKITAELLTKLATIANNQGKDYTQNLADIKAVVEEIKTKGAKADLTDTNTKIEEVKSKVEGIKGGEGKGTDYWSVGAAIGSVLAVILLFYVAFVKSGSNARSIRSEDSE